MSQFELPAEIIQDRVRVSPQEIADCATKFATDIRRRGLRRLAVTTPRVDLVIPALMACQRESCQMLLLRQTPAADSPLWSEWQVDGLLASGGEIVGVGNDTPALDTAGDRAADDVQDDREFSILLATSGTTGTPKIASHKIERLLGNIHKPREGSQSATWLLTYHPASFAGMQVVLSCLVGAGTIVAFSEWTVPQLCTAARDYAVTHASATPTFWRAFVMALEDEDRGLALRHITLGGEVADEAVLTRLRELFPAAGITHIYASTEAGALFAVRDGHAGFPAEWLTSGVGDVKLRLRNEMLEVQSPRAMKGYVNASNRGSYTDDGWLMTNDLIEIQGDRALFKGRADSVINVGGAKVSPEEVEATLLEHPDVIEAVVYGVANPITGATVAADVQTVPGTDESALRAALIQFARSRLEPYKVPRVFRFANNIHITETGKKSRQL